MKNKQSLVVFFFLCACYLGVGQVNIASSDTNYTIDFDNTVSGVNNGTLDGSGFQAIPTSGQLDSDAWAVTGWSDGDLAFGGTRTTASTDYTRGNVIAAVTTGGIYSYQGSSRMLMIQPAGSDWAPGTLTLRIQNNTGSIITDFNVAYDLFVRNDQGRSNSFNFSYSSDNVTYTTVGALNYTSTDTADALGMVLIGTKSTTIGGLAIADGAYFYIRWAGADVGGSGSRDEFGIDNIVVNGSSNPVPEINVEGNLGSFPDITNGDITPSGTDNTLFAAQFIGASQSKSYRINNEGTANLTLSTISIIGSNSSDFSVSISPSNTITPSTFSLLEITFSPLASGIRTAIVSIANNDSDENPFTFTIQGTGKCVSSSLSITPSSGPVGTTIAVIGTNFGASTTTTLSGISATHTVLSTTSMEVVVPNNASTGNIEVINDLGCTSSILFNVIDKTVGGCEGGSDLSDLLISEVTDATTGGVTYIEIYNGTGGNVQLNNYSLEVYSNGNSTSSGTISPLGPGNLSNNTTYVVAIGVAGTPDSSNTCSITGGNGELAIETSGIGGINKKDYEHDAIRLLKSSGTVVVDQFGVYMDSSWMDATSITGDRGFNFRRLVTASPLPNPNFNLNDWNIIDWAGSGQSSCSTNDYSDIGVYDFSTASPPSISTQPIASASTCDLTATLTVEANEGYVGGNGLAYQWYYSAPGDASWTLVPSGSPYSGEVTNVLDISNTLGLNGYQYYCQIRETDATCYKASNAVKLDVYTTTWNGTTWSDGVPTTGTIVTLNGNYNTGTSGNLSACTLFINSGFTLNIADNNYVEVENNLTVNGNVVVQPKGTFVQNNNSGSVDGNVLSNKTKIVVNKKTTKANNWYEYTYWSSPVEGETIADGLYESSTNRRFLFDAQNFLDHCAETNNNNICDDNGGLGLQDGIDDDNNDWQWVSGAIVMQPGVGYASTHDSTIFGSTPGCPGSSCSIEYTFEGPFNNGVYKIPVYRNDFDINDSNLNFIGNPYPSAISADDFFDLNAYSLNPSGALEGVIYLWSQNTPPSATANGNQNLNFSDLDYAIINAGTGETAGGDGLIPTRFVPSGQGFFVNYSNDGATVAINGDIKTGEVIFNNAMRVKGTTDNSQFFRTPNSKSSKSKGDSNKLWVNLSSDIGVLNQILVGYVDGATNHFDGIYYDVPRNFKAKTALALYSFNSDDESKYAIQGKDINSLNLDEVIPLGFYTAITGATLYKLSVPQFEGDFFKTNTVYLRDNLMNRLHNLSESDYTFTSEVGEFKDRFEIVFQSEALSNSNAQLNSKKLTIIELNDGLVQFKTNSSLTITSVQIIDMLGRTLYQLKGSSPSEIYNLSNLNLSTYIAKVELNNGQIITKRALKRR